MQGVRTSEPSASNMTVIRRSALQKLSYASLAVGYIWLMAMVAAVDAPIPLTAWLGALVMLLGAGISLRWCEVHSRTGSVALVGAMIMAISLALAAVGSSDVAYLFIVVNIVASVLLGSGPLFVTTLLAVSSLMWIGQSVLGWRVLSPDIVRPTFAITVSSLASWLAAGSLSTALDWALVAYEIARQHEADLRERRGELRRTLDALKEASGRLDRTNRELLVARRQSEEARVLQEQFVANVSHELRTPLNLVVGFAEMLYLSPESYDGVGWTPDLLGDIGAMYRAGRQLQNLIDDVLDLSRISAARLPMFREQAELQSLITDVLVTLAPLFEQRSLRCVVNMQDELPLLSIDRTRIRQVLINLLNNALRHTDQGEISVSVMLEPDTVVVSIRDTGVGIPTDQLENIFQEFRQADAGLSRRSGAGLGLSISRKFVELHGGKMWAESVLGQGSTFSFTLPLPGRVQQNLSLVHTNDHRRADLSKAPVLFVDSDPTVSQMLSRYLDDRPVLAVDTIANADDLVEGQHPVAVVVNEPPRAEAANWLGSIGPNAERWGVPVFPCAIPSPSWLATAVGIRECLTKPLARETLVRAIKKQFSEPADILVVDDDPGFVSLVVRMLQGTGLVRKLYTAYGGQDALALIRETRPQLLLLDLVMPETDGLAVLSELRKQGELDGMVVIAVTATSYAEDALQRRAGIFTLTQSMGYSAAQLTDLLRAALQIVSPHYAQHAIEPLESLSDSAE